MHTKDLMIGDWLLYKSDSLEIAFPIQITRAMFNKDLIIWGDRFEPISITKEILEKNSFLKVEMLEYPSRRVGISFLYRDTPEGLRIFVQNACVGGPTCTIIKTCKYVHEVQHMIKMCDIEKEIIL
jgi:hypothetical protein